MDMNVTDSAAHRVSLTQMRVGDTGTIVRMDGGHAMSSKLDSLGIRPGKIITKVSGQLMGGPVLLRQNSTEVAIGFGMASRIFVQLPVDGDKG